MSSSNSDSLAFMVLGKPGIGKSTLVNGLIGEDVALVSAKGEIVTHGVTRTVQCHRAVKEKFKIEVWDTPGLMDPEIDSMETLEMVKSQCSHVDLVLFCLSMNTTRVFGGGDETAMINMITKVLGPTIWSKTIVALVRANMLIKQIECDSTEESQIRLAFNQSFTSWRKLLEEKIPASEIEAVPVGYYKSPLLLPGDKFPWLSIFWKKAYKKLPEHKQPHLVCINRGRLVLRTNEVQNNSGMPVPDPKPRKRSSTLAGCDNTGGGNLGSASRVYFAAPEKTLEASSPTTSQSIPPPPIPPRRRVQSDVKCLPENTIARRSSTLPNPSSAATSPPVPKPRSRPPSFCYDYKGLPTPELGDISLDEEVESESGEESQQPAEETLGAGDPTPLPHTDLGTENSFQQESAEYLNLGKEILNKSSQETFRKKSEFIETQDDSSVHKKLQINNSEQQGAQMAQIPTTSTNERGNFQTENKIHRLPEKPSLSNSEVEASKNKTKKIPPPVPPKPQKKSNPTYEGAQPTTQRKVVGRLTAAQLSINFIPPQINPSDKLDLREQSRTRASLTKPEVNAGTGEKSSELAGPLPQDSQSAVTEAAGNTTVPRSAGSLKTHQNSSIEVQQTHQNSSIEVQHLESDRGADLKTMKRREENPEALVDEKEDPTTAATPTSTEGQEYPLNIKPSVVDMNKLKEKPLTIQPIIISENLFTKIKRALYNFFKIS